MTVKELIEKLEQYHSDIEVAIQYRDDGGDYDGEDSELRFHIDDGKLKL